jgi:hypothetical protein
MSVPGGAAEHSYVVEVTPSDLVVRIGGSAGGIVFSARRWVTDELDAFKRDNAGEPLDCDYEHRIEAISLVGTYLGLRDEFYASCPPEAHPAEETRLLTFDLARGGGEPRRQESVVALTDLFPAEVIRTGLQGARLFQQFLSGTQPPTLEALLDEVVDRYGEGPNDCFYVPHDLLGRFAIAGTADGHAAVVIGLPGAGPCRSNLTDVRLVLDAPSDLRPALADAAAAGAGFFSGTAGGAPSITIRLQIGRGATPPE